MSDGGHVWWEDAVVYDVYPRSFADPDGDGGEPGFVLAANLGPAPVRLPAHRDVLLASGPVAGGSLPPDTAVWLGT